MNWLDIRQLLYSQISEKQVWAMAIIFFLNKTLYSCMTTVCTDIQ